MAAVQLPKPTNPQEGAGSLNFPFFYFVGALAAAPLSATYFFGLPLVAVAPLFVLFVVPIFLAFHIYHAFFACPIRPVRTTSQRKISEFLVFADEELAQMYADKKIPIVTFFEAYFDEKVSVVGDMLQTLEARHEWVTFTWTFSQAAFFLSQWVPETLWHSRVQDTTQVREHYDRGNDFYSWFLGPMMVYTSGVLAEAAPETPETLEQMQIRKFETVLNKINFAPSDRLLDIGCGWGSLAVHAAKAGGPTCAVTGVTLARNQIVHAEEQARLAGVAERTRFLCLDYRDIPKETYSKITCLEMAEHVGVLRFQTFLRQVREMLDDDGVFFLQIAGLRRAWQYEDLMWGLFMAKYIFPGADASCPLNWSIEQLERAGFEVQSVETLGVHYAATIYRWYINWIANKENVIAKYGVRWFRIWEFFLAYSTIIARQGSATVYQIVAHKNLSAFDRMAFVKNRLTH